MEPQPMLRFDVLAGALTRRIQGGMCPAHILHLAFGPNARSGRLDGALEKAASNPLRSMRRK